MICRRWQAPNGLRRARSLLISLTHRGAPAVRSTHWAESFCRHYCRTFVVGILATSPDVVAPKKVCRGSSKLRPVPWLALSLQIREFHHLSLPKFAVPVPTTPHRSDGFSQLLCASVVAERSCVSRSAELLVPPRASAPLCPGSHWQSRLAVILEYRMSMSFGWNTMPKAICSFT